MKALQAIPSSSPSRWPAYLGAAGLTLLTLTARVTLGGWLEGPTMILFTVPIILGAYWGGMGPGLLATGLSAVGTAYYVLPPIFSFNILSPTQRWQVGFLLVAGTIISFICESLQRSRRRLASHLAIIERARDELKATLKESGDFRAALDAHSIMAITDPQWTITHVNDKFCAISQFSRQELLGQDQRIIDSAFYSNSFIRGIRTTLAQGKVWTGDVKNRAKDGSVYWVDTTLVPSLNEDGIPRQYLAVGADITERKLAEEALRQSEGRFRFLNDLVEATRTLVDPGQIMAVTARVLGEHLRASRCAYADVENDGQAFTILHDYTDGCATTVGHYRLSLFGAKAESTLQRGQTLIIRNIDAELSPGDGADTFNAIGIKAIITCPLVKEGRLRAMMAVHQTIPRDWTADEVAIVQDVVERCWATIERRTAEERLRTLNAELEQRVIERTAQLEAANTAVSRDLRVAEAAHSLKSAFLATMSHELRTPLNSIIGFTGILQQGLAGPLNAEQQTQLGMVRGSSQHLLELINDVLDLSKIEAGQMEVQTELFDLQAALERVMASIRPLADKKGLVLAAVVWPRRCEIVSDSRRVEQILINLLGNAVKFTERGSVTVTVEMAEDGLPSSTSRRTVELRVSDTGIGIKPDDLATLFQPFSQIDGGPARPNEGTGLGLAISRRIATLLDGEISAASEWAKGSTFTLTLPLPRRSPS